MRFTTDDKYLVKWMRVKNYHRRSHWPVANTAACTCKGEGTSLRTPIV